jgi:predicted HAD superfamily Cof-like phosphohydrolase
MQDILKATKQWFEKALSSPVSKNIHTQLGCHFEEVREMIIEIEGINPEAERLLGNAAHHIHELAEYLKQNDGVIVVREANRLDFLDSIADQLVTAVGSAHVLHMDPVGALDETNRSNYSKFVDGEPIFDNNRKVAKGPNYTKTDLRPFV